MKKLLRKLYFKMVKRYRRLELKFVSYTEGDKMIRETYDKPESEKWVIAKEEDANKKLGMVYLERKERITA